ncbi:MAG: DUF4145 domain-containing protein [Candidatus Woesearchaeota archaeon]
MEEAEELYKAISNVINSKIDITKKDFRIDDYKDKRAEYYKKTVEGLIKRLQNIELKKCVDKVKAKELIENIAALYEQKRVSEILPLAQELSKLKILTDEPKKRISFTVTNIPYEIKDEINADLRELEKCFENECFRSSIILCGRILETALHRKYYEITGKDILETSPGIGLGNLVAKLKELHFEFDPGISEQIHLINQVRIYSVHKKQNPFYPSKEQAQAIVLYTIDVIKKLFNQN